MNAAAAPKYVVLHENFTKKATVLRRSPSDDCYAPYAVMDDCLEARRLARQLNDQETR